MGMQDIITTRLMAAFAPESLHVEGDGDGKSKFGRPMVLVKSDPAA